MFVCKRKSRYPRIQGKYRINVYRYIIPTYKKFVTFKMLHLCPMHKWHEKWFHCMELVESISIMVPGNSSPHQASNWSRDTRRGRRLITSITAKLPITLTANPVGLLLHNFAQRWVKYQQSKLLGKLDQRCANFFPNNWEKFTQW